MERGGVAPTLNAFDMGDTRATVVICYPINTMTLGGRPDPVNDARMTLGIGDEGDPQFTISSSHPHAVATPSVVRRLTPTECERLQGFPDGWTEGQTDGHRYKQMGNAVAVPVVEWIMERLVEHDRV